MEIMKKEVKFYYVYIITNLVLNKQYVGSRMCYKDKIEDDIYWGTSKYLDEDYEIYGIENFTKEIIQGDYTNLKDMLSGESFYMHQYNTFEPNGYNRWDPAQNPGWHMGGYHRIHLAETKEKMSLIKKGKISPNKGKKMSEEQKQKLRKPRSEKTKQKMSNSRRGMILTKEHSKNHRGMIGKNHSEETKQKMRHPHRKFSEETKQNIKDAFGKGRRTPWNKDKKCPQFAGKNNSMFGKHHSEESNKKNSESHKGKIPWNKGKTLTKK